LVDFVVTCRCGSQRHYTADAVTIALFALDEWLPIHKSHGEWIVRDCDVIPAEKRMAVFMQG